MRQGAAWMMCSGLLLVSGLAALAQTSQNTKDPLTDTATDGSNNLMYWLEDSGQHLSPQQSQVVRNDMKVQP